METLRQRAQRRGTPLIDGDSATFVWCGETAPRLIGDFNHWGLRSDAPPMEREAGGVWRHTVQLPSNAYIEYVYESDNARILDPLNSRAITNGIGGFHNFFGMPDFQDTPLQRHRHDVPHGAITQHVLESQFLIVGERRTIHLYHPPVPGPYPLLVVLDGQDYLHRADLPTIVDNLIAEGRIQPIAIAMIEHGDSARSVEYNCNDATVALLMRTVVPLAREHLELAEPSGEPSAWAILGASLGGLMSLYAALREPETFGRVISQSGAFGDPEHERVVTDMVRYFPLRPLKIWMSVGRYEPLVAQNRRMRALLLQLAYDGVTYSEYNGGHNYTFWKNDVWRGLEATFPPAS